MTNANGVTFRTYLRPGDLGWIVFRHGVLYADEYGFDSTFEAYVAGPMAEFVRAASARERIWIAEQADRVVGCIAIVASAPQVAQVRWYLVEPPLRGQGFGKRMLNEAIRFAHANGYEAIILWTVSALREAAHLYRSAGFQVVERKPGRCWGIDLTEERYELALR